MISSILVDTSAWIDYFNGANTNSRKLVRECLKSDYTILLCPIILQEVLQGIKSDSEYLKIKTILLSFDMLELNAVDAAIGSANIYRTLRKKGITIRKSVDCLIAYYAISFDVALLHNDSDFKLIASNLNLKSL